MRYDAIVTISPIGPFYFVTFLPSCYCEWISLDPHSHNQHIHDNKPHRLLNISISFLVGYVVRSHWIPAHMTNIHTLHWPMVSYIRQSPLLL